MTVYQLKKLSKDCSMEIRRFPKKTEDPWSVIVLVEQGDTIPLDIMCRQVARLYPACDGCGCDGCDNDKETHYLVVWVK